MADELRFFTIKEVALILRVNEWSIREGIKSGKIRATKPLGTWRIAERDLRDLLAANSNQAAS